MGVEKMARVEGDELFDQAQKRGVVRRLDRGVDATEKVGEIVGAQRQSRHDSETAPASPLRPQKRSGLMQALAITTAPSAVTISASRRLAAAVPNCLEWLPKPPARTRPATPTVRHPPPCT